MTWSQNTIECWCSLRFDFVVPSTNGFDFMCVYFFFYSYEVAACCSMLQCVAVCDSVLHCVAVSCSVLHFVTACRSVSQRVAMCCSVLQSAAVGYSMLHRVPACCSVLQCSFYRYWLTVEDLCHGTKIGEHKTSCYFRHHELNESGNKK